MQSVYPVSRFDVIETIDLPLHRLLDWMVGKRETEAFVRFEERTMTREATG